MTLTLETSLTCLVTLAALGCTPSPIELEDTGGGSTTGGSVATTGDRPGASGGETTTPSTTSPAWDTTTAAGTWTDGPATWTDGFDGDTTEGDGWETDGSPDGPTTCWELYDERECMTAPKYGLACAWVARYSLSSALTCEWSALGATCEPIAEPADPACTAAPSCADGRAGTYWVSDTNLMVAYDGCGQLVDHEACTPESPSPWCACACTNPP